MFWAISKSSSGVEYIVPKDGNHHPPPPTTPHPLVLVCPGDTTHCLSAYHHTDYISNNIGTTGQFFIDSCIKMFKVRHNNNKNNNNNKLCVKLIKVIPS